MVNLLIVENDTEQCKNILNYVCKCGRNIKLHSIAFNEEDAIELIKGEDPDIILLDLNLPGFTSYNILNYIGKNDIEKYDNSIVLLCNRDVSAYNAVSSKFVNICYRKPVEMQVLLDRLEQLAVDKIYKLDLNQVQNKIRNELQRLHYNFSLHGSKYLLELIYELYNFRLKNLNYDNLKRDVYPILAERYNKKPNTIKCDIAQATKHMLEDCDQTVLLNYFHYRTIEKPTVKEVIFTILNNI